MTWHAVAEQNGLTITPVHEFEGTLTVGVSADSRDGDLVSVPATAITVLIVDPVAKQPVVSASATEIPEDGVSALTITLVNASELFEDGNDRSEERRVG